MYDKTLIREALQQVEEVICTLLEGTKNITDINELPQSADGMLRLNGICMSILVIGEEIKKIDQRTDKELLPLYPTIPWHDIMGMRDKIAHDYFGVDINVVFDTLRNDVAPLLPVIRQMQNDLCDNL